MVVKIIPTFTPKRIHSPLMATSADLSARPLLRPSHRDRRAWIAPLIVVLLTLATYLPSLGNRYIWDDDYYVTSNLTLRSLHGLERIWCEPGAVPQYYPLTFTTFWVEYHLWQLRPLGYHVDNMLLQAMNALLLGLLLRKLRVPGAWLAAALFAVHPVEVETVAWISERKNLLSGFFYLLAALVYCRIGAIPHVAGSRARSRWYGLSLVLFACALLSKTVACTLPAAVLVVIWWKRGRLRWSDLWPLLPMFIAGAIMGSITGWMEQHHVGAHGPEWAFTIGDRMLIAGRAVWFYAGRLLWPVRLQFIYHRWTLNTSSVLQWIAPITAIAAVLILWFARRRIGRAPLAAALLYIGTLAPALGFVNLYPMRYSFVADHFQYLASAWFIAAIAAVAVRLPTHVRISVIPLLSAALMILTILHSRVFYDAPTLWADVLSKDPTNWIANNNYGDLLLKQNHFADAEPHFAIAAANYPHAAKAWTSLGYLAERQKQYARAMRYYEIAVRERPSLASAHYDLANMFLIFNHLDEAVQQYHQCLAIDPTMSQAHGNLGIALLHLGKPAEAKTQFQIVLRLNPNLEIARKHLAETRTSSDRK